MKIICAKCKQNECLEAEGTISFFCLECEELLTSRELKLLKHMHNSKTKKEREGWQQLRFLVVTPFLDPAHFEEPEPLPLGFSWNMRLHDVELN